jgi:CDGSH-type Zn-finger protein
VPTPDQPPAISITSNGPYIVSGKIPLSVERIAINDEGECWEFEPGRNFEVAQIYALCRCGESANKPFCDGTHVDVAFQDGLSAER